MRESLRRPEGMPIRKTRTGRKSLSLAVAAAVTVSSVVPASAEETAPAEPPKISLDAAVRKSEGLDLVMKNRPDEVSNLKIYEGSDLVKAPVAFQPGGIARVSGADKAWMKLSVERSGLNASGTLVTESRSSQLTVATPETTYLKPNARREIQRDVPVYAIPVQWGRDFSSLSFSGAAKDDGKLRTRYSVAIGSGPELPLTVAGDSESFRPGVAYVTPTAVVLHEKSLTEPENRVTLKADSVPLNYVTVRKRADLVGEITDVTATSSAGNDRVNVSFRNVGAIKNLEQFEFRVNDKLVDPSDPGSASTTGSTVTPGFGGSGPIVFSLHPSILGPKETVARIRIKDKNSFLYDTASVDLSKYVVPNVASVETVPGQLSTNFKIAVDPVSISGDYEKLSFAINGTKYTSRGVKTPRKNASGTVLKDMYGNELYDFTDKLEFRKTTTGLEFSFPTEKLKKTGNTFELTNGNSELSSQEVVFDLGKPAFPAKPLPSGKETLKFDAGTSETKPVDPVARPNRDAMLGTFSLGDLDAGAYYRFTARAFVPGTYGTFASATVGNPEVHSYPTDGGVVYEFAEEGLGASIQRSYAFTVRLSDFLATGKTTAIEWKAADLERADGDGFRKIASAAGTKGSFVHTAEWNACADASTETCGANGLPAEPTSIFEFAFGKPVETVLPAPKPAPKPAEPPKAPETSSGATSTGSVQTPPKPVSDPFKLTVSAGAGALGTVIAAKIGKAYEAAREKYAGDRKKRGKLAEAKKAVEKLYATAKAYDQAKLKPARKALVKRLVNELKQALKKIAAVAK